MEIEKVPAILSDDQLHYICMILNAAIAPLEKVVNILSFDDSELMRNALYREWTNPFLATPFGDQVADALVHRNNALSRVVPENYLDPDGAIEVEQEVRKAAALVILDWMPLMSVDYVSYLNKQLSADLATGTVNPITVDYSKHFLETMMDWYEAGHALVLSGCVRDYINKQIRPESRDIIRNLIVILQSPESESEAPLTQPAAITIYPKAHLQTSSTH